MTRLLRGRADRAARAVLCLAVSVCAVACSPGVAGAPVRYEAPASVQVDEGVTYWSGAGGPLLADVCSPSRKEGRRSAVLLVHGGGFTDGSRTDEGIRNLCMSLAEHGQVGVAVDYRLAPDFVYPAQVDDLANAVAWVRSPEQVDLYDLDPSKVAVIGSSAGALIAQQLAVRGEGARTSGTRVSAVVSLSGLSVLDADAGDVGSAAPEAVQLVTRYLGCQTLEECPAAAGASPVNSVDASDPPMLLVNGTSELVPADQAEDMSRALTTAGVRNRVVLVDGSSHGLSLLNADVRRQVELFLRRQT